ncbi:TPA: DUF3265 domain-containing protein, partial [Vibrio vulnificus]|nr:DUF3265 domain-containing protein [Vibrio vulnificus]
YAVSFGGESGLRKVGLGGNHPLTRRYVFFQHQRIYWCWSLERQRQF